MSAAEILIVEDEFIIAELVKEMLEDAGHGRCAHAASVKDALALIPTRTWKGAILDIRLQGELVFPAAEALQALGVPFAFSTGDGEGADIPAQFADAPVLPKPWTGDAIDKLAQDLFGRSRAA